MRVFVTGATGFVGSAVVSELTAAGHRVTGLARSDVGASALAAAGAEVQRGDIRDLESLRHGAAGADAVIHLAFIHDFSRFEENCAIDARAIEALGTVTAGSGALLMVTSGFALLRQGSVGSEEDGHNPAFPRKTEEAAAAASSRGARVVVVRLPIVHGDGDHGFVPLLIGLAREKGVSAYVGEGLNRWPAVHRLDAARLYRLALEKGAAGARYHAVADEGVPLHAIAQVIGRRLQVPVASRTAEEAEGHFGWFANFAALDLAASSARTRERLGWHPTEPSLIEDLDRPEYFPALTARAY